MNVYLLYSGAESGAEREAFARGIDANLVGSHNGYVVLEASMSCYPRILLWWLASTSLAHTLPANTPIKKAKAAK